MSSLKFIKSVKNISQRTKLVATNSFNVYFRLYSRAILHDLKTDDLNIALIKTDSDDQSNPLEICNKDLSNIPTYFPIPDNFTGYIDDSITLKKLLQLGVDLHKLEKRQGMPSFILKQDFDRHLKDHIFFLKDYVDNKTIGNFLTKNPLIFKESLDDLEVRINYLKSKRFKLHMIQQIVTKNPFWLMFSTSRIDRRLGFFQNEFSLTGNEVRAVSVTQPKLITYNLHHVNVNKFSIQEEMGFEKWEIKKMLLIQPKLWMIHQMSLLRRFQYLHNVMKISHKQISETPGVLLSREFRIRQRHTFLEKLGRAQYDCTRENYVSLDKLVAGTDADFCQKVAKCCVDDFNIFLKTL